MKYEEFFESIKDVAAQLSQLHAQIASQQEPVVRHLIATQSRDSKAIERTLDQLLDIACHDEGLKLFRRLCRYYWDIHPQATAGYINAYRELWDDVQDDSPTTEVAE